MNKHFIFYTKWATICNIILLLFILLCSFADASELAIRTIAYEGSGEDYKGQVAIASVIKTRMKERKQSADQVVLAPYQFSCWHPKTSKPTQSRELTKKELNKARRAWYEALPGKYNHYARWDCKPYWIKHAKKTLHLGEHTFYQL